MTRRITNVAIVGADAPAWMAACAIRQSFGRLGVQVRLIEVPSLLQRVDVYSALPTLAGLHHQLRLEEQVLFDLCKALPVAGQRYAHWSGAETAFIQGYDLPSSSGAGLGFRQLWIKGRQSGLRTEYENFSLGAMAAKAGRVPSPSPDQELSSDFGYNLDARAYSAALKRFALQRGVEAKAADLSDVQIEGERIVAIVLNDGERVEADLFVDASGPRALLLDRMPGAGFESWRTWLPCDRLLAASSGPLRPYPAFSQLSAFEHGWIGVFPLQDRAAIVACYDDREISDQEMVERLPVLAKLPVTGEAVVSPLQQGMRNRAWVGNCVAVGEAAFSLEPLGAVHLHGAHYCVSQLMSLFPVEAEELPEAQLYNRIIRQAAINLRDFHAAHYKLNRRFAEPLWDRCLEAQVPESLQRKLDIFAARGRIPLYDDETFQEDGWECLFMGHGLTPENYDPRVDAIPEQEQIAMVHTRLAKVAELVGAMPTVDQFVGSSSAAEPAEVTHDG